MNMPREMVTIPINVTVPLKVNFLVKALIMAPWWRKTPTLGKGDRCICWCSIVIAANVFTARRGRIFFSVIKAMQRTSIKSIK